VARRPAAADERQADFFGAPAPAPEPATPGARPAAAPQPGPKRDAKRRLLPSPGGQDARGGGGPGDTLAARLSSPAELDELAAALPDDALARLTLAAVRQLRRRLARSGGRGGASAALERAARHLAAELGGQAGSDDA
jgi:hypothetical protein